MSEEPSEVDLTISSIWIQERVSCPPRDILKKFVDGSLSTDAADYIQFHIREIGCPFCQASEEDLRLGKKPERGEEDMRQRLFDKTSKFLRKKK